MRDSELISKAKKTIMLLEAELKEKSAQLGGVFYDSGIKLEDSSIEDEIDRLENIIPEIKAKMDKLKSYNLSISEAEDGLKTCSDKIKELQASIGSIFEKVGVELYCFIGDRERAFPVIDELYKAIKKGESISETLENRLYAYENSVAKKGVLNLFSKPFKVRSLKKDIRQNNKESLKKFRELGSAYTDIPELIDAESNESLLDVVEDFRVLKKNIKNQEDRQLLLQKRIEENEQRIKEDSNGVRLKTLYAQLEDEIVDTQNKITDKLVELGNQVAVLESVPFDNGEVESKLLRYREKSDELSKERRGLEFLEKRHQHSVLSKEIADREGRIRIEEEHIAQRVKALEEHKVELDAVKADCDNLAIWLKDHA